MDERELKHHRLWDLLAVHGRNALVLRRVSNIAWITGGADVHVNRADSFGIAALVMTPTGRYAVTNTIEAPRLTQEEKLAELGWEVSAEPWHEPADRVATLTKGLMVGTDGGDPGAVDLTAALTRLRANLTPEEGDRFRTLGRLCAEAMDVAARAVRPGQTEYEIAGRLAYEAERRGVQVIVNLIATDERIFNFRHPVPNDKALDRYAMLVLCGRRQGLVCSITRLVHFGVLPADLRRKVDAVAHIDAAMIAATRPGVTLGSIFHEGMQAYATAGYPDEWRLHHQGGLAGYEPREIIATPTSTERVSIGQVYAWNPSITGAKSEDSILVGADAVEVLTAIPNWPTINTVVNGQVMSRPAVLEYT